MSMETWKAEFYPVNAWVKMTKKEAIAHSLRKWEGLTKKNLRAHGIHKFCAEGIGDMGDHLWISASSCALCAKYWSGNYKCDKCPLQKFLGKPCDAVGMPYLKFLDTGATTPMISALRSVLKGLEKNGTKQD